MIFVFLTKFIIVVILADFIAGLVHWWEDAYIRKDTPIIGNLIGKNNMIHHYYPRYFTKFGWFASSWDLLLLGMILLTVAWIFGFLTWPIVLFSILSINANQIHKFSHRTKEENGKIINFLQKYKIILTPKHHYIHHTNPKNSNYCPITNIVNPFLDYINFWSGVEYIIYKTLNIKRKPDPSVESKIVPSWITVLVKK